MITLDGVHLFLVAEQNWVSKTKYIRLFLNLEHLYCPGGWVDSDQNGPSTFLTIGYSNKQFVLIPDMLSNIAYEF